LAFGALAALSIAIDWWRHWRKTRGTAIVPWSLIAVLSLIVAAYCLAGWLREG